jgi:hypothetical protein
MHVSLQSKVCLGVCVAAGAYHAYSNPSQWITWFALGVIVGAIESRFNSNFIADSSKNTFTDMQHKREYIENCIPNPIATIMQVANVVLINQKIRFSPKVDRFLSGVPLGAASVLGRYAANLVYLEILRRKPDPHIQQLLRPIVL